MSMTQSNPIADDDASSAKRPPRLVIVDVARGVALIAMATYHFSWDIEFFKYLDAGTTAHGVFRLYARLIASSFLFLAGFSFVLANTPGINARAFALRFGKIAAAALVITAVTWFAMPDAFIFFGILHAIAACSLVGLLFLRLPLAIPALVAVAAFLAPFYLRSPVFDLPALWWVGLSETLPRSNDYVPLLPWLAPFLAGLFAARLGLATGFIAVLARWNQPAGRIKTVLSTLGRWSLAFYLVHQPLLFAIVYGVSLVFPAPAPDPAMTYMSNCVSACSAQPAGVSCQTFCSCTLDALRKQDLFDALNSGTIDVGADSRIADMSAQCTMDATEE